MEYMCDYPDTVDEFRAFSVSAQPVKYRVYNIEPVRPDNSQIGFYLAYTKLDQGRD